MSENVKKVAVVGGGPSAAEICAAISAVAGFNVVDAAMKSAIGPRVSDSQCEDCKKRSAGDSKRWCSEWRHRPRDCSLKRGG